MDRDSEIVSKLLGDQAWLLTAVLRSTKSGIVITDYLAVDNPIIYCNTAFEELTGYSNEEVIGRNCRFLQGYDFDEDSRIKIKSAVSNGVNCYERILNYRKDGTPFINELFVSPVKDATGKITHFIGVQNQINEAKESELESETLLPYTETKFQMMSHSINTPLTVLTGSLQLMNRFLDSEHPLLDQQSLLDRSNLSLKELTKAIDEFLKNELNRAQTVD